MNRRVQRGIAAFAFVVVLGMAGARPAAAAPSQGFRFLDRLAGVWSLVTGSGERAVRTIQARWTVTEKVGAGLDPNGALLTVETEEQPKPPADRDGQR